MFTVTARHSLVISLFIAAIPLYMFRSITNSTRPYMFNISEHSSISCPNIKYEPLEPLTGYSETGSRQHTLKLTHDFSRGIVQMLVGLTCDRSGGRYFILFSVLLGAISICIWPLIVDTSPLWAVQVYHVLTGAFGAMGMPPIMSLLASWAPYNKRSLFLGVVYAGAPLSVVVEYSIIKFFMVQNKYWQSAFYVCGMIGFFYCIFCMYTVFSKPGMHPMISQKEKLMLMRELGTRVPTKVPIRKIITDSRILAILFGKVGHIWIQNTSKSYLPLYFTAMFKENVKTDYYLMIFPHVCQLVSIILLSIYIQHAINRNRLQVMQVRILCAMSGAILPAILLIALPYADCYIIPVHIIRFLIFTTMSSMNLGVKANILDITSHFAGFCEGMINGSATIIMVGLPYVVDNFITKQTAANWSSFFWVTLGCVSFLLTMNYIFVGVNRAKWDHLPAGNYRDYAEDIDSDIDVQAAH